MIIFDNFDTAVSDKTQAMRLILRPISRNIRSNSEVVLGAITPVLSHIPTYIQHT